jgi:pimeloyl-ACP methyl ester carboxylesterase
MAPALPAVAGVTHRDVVVRGARLHVAQAGSGPPLVLLHGWPQHWFAWRKLIGPLAEHYTVIAPDLRGWGWSDAPDGDYAKSGFAQDIVGLLDHEGFERVRLMGHDWGGYTAFLLALDYPQRIERLVALDIVPPWPGRPRLSHLALPLFLSYQVLLASPLGAPLMMRLPGFVRAIVRLGSGPGMHWSPDELDAYAEVLRDPARARASSACYRTFLTREFPASARTGSRASELRVPTLLLMGGASSLYRVIGVSPSANLRVEVIPRAGHFLGEEAPTQVLDHALPFLSG